MATTTTTSNKQQHHIYCTSLVPFLLLAACLVCSVAVQTVLADSALDSSLEKFKIYPNIVPSLGLAPIRLEIHNNLVKPGDSVPAKNFRNVDTNKITWDASTDDSHTLIMVDLDRRPSGSNSSKAFYNLFTSVNFKGNAIGRGQTIVAYEPPNVPCQPSTKHRILMLALYQSQSLDLMDIAYISAAMGQSNKRENFDLPTFISRHSLEPVAANVFWAVGEANGICSSSTSLHSMASSLMVSSLAMVMAITALITLPWRS